MNVTLSLTLDTAAALLALLAVLLGGLLFAPAALSVFTRNTPKKENP